MVKNDLEKRIREAHEMICEYRDIMGAADPLEKKRADRIIKKQWELIDGYLAEYIPLCQRLHVPIASDLVEIIAHFQRYADVLVSH